MAQLSLSCFCRQIDLIRLYLAMEYASIRWKQETKLNIIETQKQPVKTREHMGPSSDLQTRNEKKV